MARVERQALLAMCHAWRTFKSKLVTKYMNTGRTPFTKYPFLMRDIWDAFVAMKTTAKFKEQSAAHKALWTQNTHLHRLGTAKYMGKSAEWATEDENAAGPFLEITDPRALSWLKARAKVSSSGSISFTNSADQEVSQRLLELIAETSKGSFQADREKDMLSTALGNKEHPGRMRGLGVTVPWSYRFRGDYDTYRSRKRSKAEHEDRLDQMNQLLNQSQAAPVILGASPPRHRSSIASTHNSEHDDVQLPIDDIKEPTPCKLQVRMVESISIEAGRGLAYPCQEGTVQHGAQLAQGYARVQVDMTSRKVPGDILIGSGKHPQRPPEEIWRVVFANGQKGCSPQSCHGPPRDQCASIPIIGVLPRSSTRCNLNQCGPPRGSSALQSQPLKTSPGENQSRSRPPQERYAASSQPFKTSSRVLAHLHQGRSRPPQERYAASSQPFKTSSRVLAHLQQGRSRPLQERCASIRAAQDLSRRTCAPSSEPPMTSSRALT
uniref:PH01B001I13.5 protein n=1 Tax=Phyllostachys edulis TaxID=38705 RepID=L0P1L1_PHYED|nr:PH01B001I13.5 [Phyllostachys edulis]